jgi:cell division transport system permease protein
VHLRTALQHIRRSPYQTIAAVLTMTLSFFILAIFASTVYNLQTILTDIEKRPQITIFFSDIKSEDDIRLLDESIKATGKVESTIYKSKDEALELYQEQNQDDPLLLEMVTADILPASLEIKAVKPEYLTDIAEVLENEPGVEDVVYLKDEVDSLISWIGAIRMEGIILVSILIAVALLVMLMVISMKIALKRKEIEILKLLGATNWYIRSPFLIEGALYGTISAILAWGVSYLRLLYATPYLEGYSWGLPLLSNSSPIEFMLPLLAVLVLVGLFVGVIGSLLALLRYS